MNQKTLNLSKLKRKLLGMKFIDGLLFKIIVYALLIVIGFVFIYPLLTMLSFSLMSLDDLLNPMISQVPSNLDFTNYVQAFKALDYFKVLGTSLIVTLIPAIMQTIIASLVGYGFARFEFPLKKTLFALVLATYIMPPQVTMIPKYVLFNDLGILNTVWAIIIPSTLGQGLNAAVFILIFYQFYKMIPKALDEAAQIDGASRFYIYFKIALRLSVPSIITSILFAFVWQWNETYMTLMFLGDKVQTLQTRLAIYVSATQGMLGSSAIEKAANESQAMAANILIIIPMLLVYGVLQRWFIEGIDKSGITGE